MQTWFYERVTEEKDQKSKWNYCIKEREGENASETHLMEIFRPAWMGPLTTPLLL